jgi:hypothetical protein
VMVTLAMRLASDVDAGVAKSFTASGKTEPGVMPSSRGQLITRRWTGRGQRQGCGYRAASVSSAR